MNLIHEAQRSLCATVGAAAWVVDALRDAPSWVGNAWRERDQVVHRFSDAYEELSERGKVIMGGTQQELEARVGEVDQAARRIPGVAEAEGAVAGAFTGEKDLPISHYDTLTADEIVHKLPGLAQLELRKVRGYETRNQARATVIGRIDKLCEEQPWPGYDELTLEEILPKARELSDAERTRLVSYERRHKNRRTIAEAFSHT